MEKAFVCRMCGNCCYGKGGIIVKSDEVERISRSMELGPEPFRSDYCTETDGTLSIISGKDGFCIFYDETEKCLINTVKPEICSLWPFFPANIKDKDSWELVKDACPGINKECSFEEFVKQSKE